MTAMTPMPTPAPDGAVEVEGSRAMTAVWGATVLFSTGPVMIATSSASGPVLSFWRMWAGLPMLGAVALWNVRRSGRRPTNRGYRLAVLAGMAFAFHQLMLMTALRTTTVIDVTLMNTLCPVVVAGLAVPMFGERPGVRFRLWSLVAILGAVAVAVLGSTGAQGQPVGMALAASNVTFYSIYFVWSKQARAHIDTWPFLFVAFGTATVLVSMFAAAIRADLRSIGAHDIAIAVAVAAGPGLLGHGTMTWSLKYVRANVPPIVMLMIPLLSGAMAWLVLGQSVGVAKVGAGILTLAGVLGAVRSPTVSRLSAIEALALAEET